MSKIVDLLILLFYIFYIFVALRELSIFLLNIFYKGDNSKNINKISMHKLPKVAIIQTICNDFDFESLQTLTNINYKNKTLFILDDSNNNTLSKTIPHLKKVLNCNIKYFHRNTNKGYKAGNINFGLSKIPSEFKYIFLADSDQKVTPNFLLNGVQFLEDNSDYAFIQWFNEPYIPINGDLPNNFAEAHSVRSYKSSIYRSIFNNVPCIGHGALIRKSVLDVTKGFPEIVSEDAAWTYELFSKNKRGIFFNETSFQEAFPRDYSKFSSRYRRWCSADLECSILALPKVIKSRHLSFWVKFDLCIGQLRLSFVPFTMIYALLILNNNNSSQTIFQSSFLAISSVLVFCTSFLNVFKNMKYRNGLNIFCNSIGVYYSQLLIVFAEFIKLIYNKGATFYVTGSNEQSNTTKFWGTYVNLLFGSALLLYSAFYEFHPLIIFLGMNFIMYFIHRCFQWRDYRCIIIRKAIFIWSIIWIINAISFDNIWRKEIHFLVTSVSLFF